MSQSITESVVAEFELYTGTVTDKGRHQVTVTAASDRSIRLWKDQCDLVALLSIAEARDLEAHLRRAITTAEEAGS